MNQIEKAISAILKTSLAEKEKGNAILAILATSEESQTSSTIPKKHHKNPPQETFVYLIGNSEGHTKIGFSGNPQKRLLQLKTGCPSAKLLHKFSGTMSDEKYLQSTFINKQIANEWFSLDESDIEIIINYFDLKKKTIKNTYPSKGRGRSTGLEYVIIKDAVLDGSYFKFKETCSVRNLVDYVKSISPNGTGISKDTASYYMALLREDMLPLSHTEWERKNANHD